MYTHIKCSSRDDKSHSRYSKVNEKYVLFLTRANMDFYVPLKIGRVLFSKGGGRRSGRVEAQLQMCVSGKDATQQEAHKQHGWITEFSV